MKEHTVEEIEAKVKEIWAADWFYDEACTRPKVEQPEVKVVIREGTVAITLQNMYEAPGLSFAHLKALSAFFDTDNINDDDRFGYGGCETCDYGSCYGFTLTVRPMK